MSAKSFRVTVVSAEEEIFSGEAEFVALPGEEGELGILPGHIPLLTRMRPGTVRIEAAGGDRSSLSDDTLVFVDGGVVEIRPDEVIILADTALRGKDIDEQRAEAACKAAQDSLSHSKSMSDSAHAQVELAIAMAQIATLRHLRSRRR